MKYAAIVMALLVAIGLAVGGYTYANARLELVFVNETTALGLERAQDFAKLQEALDQNAMLGTAYIGSLGGSCTDYNFETYTFRLRNKGLIGAEMVEVQPIPVEGDMLSYTTLDALQVNANLTVPAGQERDAYCVVLVRADQDQLLRMQRRFTVTYYMWGIPRTMTVRYE